MPNSIIVQKYGGACLETPAKIRAVASSLADLHSRGHRVVAIVSAMGKTTDELVKMAYQVSPHPNRRELDMLLTTGERISMSLMSMALSDFGVPAISFTGSQAGVMTDESHSSARILDVRPVRVREELDRGRIVVLAGFQGVIVLCLAGLVGVPYAAGLLALVFVLQLLLAFAITAFGVMVAARITQMQSFMALMQMAIMPMYFLSGALFPVFGLPQWLAILNRLDPLTYAVDPMRRLVFSHLHISALALKLLDLDQVWWLVSPQNPLKPVDGMAPFAVRLE